MKHRLTAWLLACVLTLGLMVPAAALPTENAVEETDELVLLDTIQLDQTAEESGFLKPPSALPPEIPEEGFLLPLEEPLRTPGENGLMREVTESTEGMTEITTQAELEAITAGGSYYLGCDIALANFSGLKLTGELTLDGQGHTLSGLETALFLSGGSGLTLRNLQIEVGECLTSPWPSSGTGVIMYTGCGSALTVENCTVRGDLLIDADGATVTGGSSVAGFIPTVDENDVIRDCAFIGSVTAYNGQKTQESNYTGGIAAKNLGLITDCYVEGAVIGGFYAGGIVAQNAGTVTRCTARPTLVEAFRFSGGIAGTSSTAITDCRTEMAEDGRIHQTNLAASSGLGAGGILGQGAGAENCYILGGTINADGYYLGGIVGDSTAPISHCYADGTVINFSRDSYQSHMGLIAGAASAITDCAARGTVSGSSYFGSGGIAGTCTTVERCVTWGTMQAGWSGGIAGRADLVKDCCSFMEGSNAGIIFKGSAKNCYITGVKSLLRGGIAVEADTVADCAVRDCAIVGTDLIYRDTGGISAEGASSIKDCIVENTTISGGSSNAGGIDGGANGSISDCTVANCTISGAEQAGGILVGSTVVINCTVTDSTITAANYAGGIRAHGDYGITDCTVTGCTVTATGGTGMAGGIVGSMDYAHGIILGCTVDADVSAHCAGGIAGRTTIPIRNCTSSGTVTGSSIAGGILGSCGGASSDLIRLDGCTSSAEVTANYAGGIAGSARLFSLQNCHSTSHVAPLSTESSSASFIGGLVGQGYNTQLTQCTFSGTLSAAHTMGGLIGSEEYCLQADDCHVTVPLAPTGSAAASRFGGLAGNASCAATTLISNCTSRGLSYTGDAGYVGGLIGQVDAYTSANGSSTSVSIKIERCTVNGDVVVEDTLNSSQTGGLIGYASNIRLAGCRLNGDVIVTDVENLFSPHCGILVASCGTASPEIYYYQCSYAPGASDTDFTTKYNGTADILKLWGNSSSSRLKELTAYTYSSSDYLDIPVTITVLGGDIGGDTGYPLSNALVTVAGQSGYTDSNGQFTFRAESSFFSGLQTVKVEHADYQTTETVHLFTVNRPFLTVSIWRLDPGRIFIDGGSVQLTTLQSRGIFSSANVRFGIDDETSYPVQVKVNWNGHEPGQVYLRGTKSGAEVPLTVTATGAQGHVKFGPIFSADEPIQVVAVTAGTDEYGVLEERRLTSWMVKPLEVKLVVEDTGEGNVLTDGKEESTFFLEDASIKLDLENLANCASSMTLKNGVLTITFKMEDSTKQQAKLFNTSEMTIKDQVSVAGTLSIPMAHPDTDQWKGSVEVSINETGSADTNGQKIKKEDAEAAKKGIIHEHTFDFYVAGVPCYVEASIGVNGKAQMEIYGSLETAGFKGSLSGGFTGSVGGGLGGNVGESKYNDKPAVEIKVGIYGELTGTADMTIDTGSTETNGFSTDPSIKGEVGGKASVHLFFLDLSQKLTLGEFTWDKNGLTWPGKDGEETQTLQSSSGEWQLMDRSYLADMVIHDIDGLALQATDGATVLVENIKEAAETASVKGGGNLVYYTLEDADVAEGQNAMKLYGKVGTKAAAVLDDTATSDLSPSASGNFVAWVDVKETAEADLETFLMNTEIAVSRSTSTTSSKFEAKTILTDETENSHVYAPVMTTAGSATTNNAAVAWLRTATVTDENGDLLFFPETTEIWYALCTNKVWGSAVKAATVDGAVTSLTAAFDGSSTDTLYLDYQVEDQVRELTITTADGTVADALLADGVYTYVRNRQFVSWQNEQGLYLGTADAGTYLPVTDNLNEAPVLAVYHAATSTCRYAFWAVNDQIWGAYSANNGTTWNAPQLLSTEDGYVHELTAYTTSSSAIPVLTYLVDTDSGTNLCTRTPAAFCEVASLSVTRTDVLANLRYHSPNSTSATCAWSLTDSSGTVLASGSTSVPSSGTAEVAIPRTDLPMSEELTFSTDTDAFTFTLEPEDTPPALVLEDAFWEDDVLQALVVPYTIGDETLTFSLSDLEGTELASCAVTGDDYISGLPASGVLDYCPESDGVYLLTVSLGEAEASMLVGYGDPMPKAGAADSGVYVDKVQGGTVTVGDGGHVISADMIPCAARYADGRMSQILTGQLTAEDANTWRVTFPQEVRGWTLYFLTPGSLAPVCEILPLV